MAGAHRWSKIWGVDRRSKVGSYFICELLPSTPCDWVHQYYFAQHPTLLLLPTPRILLHLWTLAIHSLWLGSSILLCSTPHFTPSVNPHPLVTCDRVSNTPSLNPPPFTWLWLSEQYSLTEPPTRPYFLQFLDTSRGKTATQTHLWKNELYH